MRAGIARDDRVGRHRFDDDGARAHHRAASDRDSRQQRGIGSDRCALLHDRRQELRGPPPAARKAIVRERRVRADEDVVLDAYAIPELDAAFHGDAVADDDVVLDERVIADVAVGADARARAARARTPRSACAARSSSIRTSPADAGTRSLACLRAWSRSDARTGALICAPPRVRPCSVDARRPRSPPGEHLCRRPRTRSACARSRAAGPWCSRTPATRRRRRRKARAR